MCDFTKGEIRWMNYRLQYLARPNGCDVYSCFTQCSGLQAYTGFKLYQGYENVIMRNATDFYGGVTHETYQEVPLITFHH